MWEPQGHQGFLDLWVSYVAKCPTDKATFPSLRKTLGGEVVNHLISSRRNTKREKGPEGSHNMDNLRGLAGSASSFDGGVGDGGGGAGGDCGGGGGHVGWSRR